MRSSKIEKISIFILCFSLFVLSGCCSSGRVSADDAVIISGNSYSVGNLEATITALDGAVSDSRERIANVIETSRSITDGIERVEYLFNEYESEVNRLLNDIDRIRIETQKSSEDHNDSNINTDSGGDSSGRSVNHENKVWD